MPVRFPCPEGHSWSATGPCHFSTGFNVPERVRNLDWLTAVLEYRGSVNRAVLQGVSEIDEPHAQDSFVGDADRFRTSGIRVEQPEHEARDLVVDAGQLGHEHQLVMP